MEYNINPFLTVSHDARPTRQESTETHNLAVICSTSIFHILSEIQTKSINLSRRWWNRIYMIPSKKLFSIRDL